MFVPKLRLSSLYTSTRVIRHTRREAGIRTPVRAYYQYGESPYQSKPKTLKLKVTASLRGGVESNWK